MATPKPKKPRGKKSASPLMVRLDADSKRSLVEAASLRKISVSDYVRTVTVPQAERELRAVRQRTISLSADEQLIFWNALRESPKLTAAQRHLASVMRGKE